MAFSGQSFPTLAFGSKFRGIKVQPELPVSVVRNGGFEYRTLRFGYPRRTWTIPARNLVYQDAVTLLDFYYSMGGNLQSFLYQDPQAAPLNGFAIGAGTQLATPAAPTLSSGGAAGPLTGTYTYAITAVNAQGETVAGPTASITVSGAVDIFLSWPAVPGAVSYNVYGRIAGSLGLLFSTTSTSPYDDGGYTPGAAPPTINSTGTLTYPVLISLDGLSHPLFHLNGLTVSPSNGTFSIVNGQPTLTFPEGSAPQYGTNVTLTGSYSLAARFDMSAGWALQNAVNPSQAPLAVDAIKMVEVFE